MFEEEEYQSESYFELLEIATEEQDIKKRKALFKLANKRLKKKFSAISSRSGDGL